VLHRRDSSPDFTTITAVQTTSSTTEFIASCLVIDRLTLRAETIKKNYTENA